MASPSLSAELSPRRLLSVPRNLLFRLAEQIRETLARTLYTPPAGSPVSVKSLLESLLPQNTAPKSVDREIKNFCLCCAALASAEGVESPSVYWIPKDLSSLAKSALREISAAGSFAAEHEMVAELMAEVLPELKAVVKETCVDPDEEVFVAGSVRAPVVNSIVAAHQFRWLVTQVIYPHLGNLCALVMPCALTTLDHWSPEVKEQGMLALIHLGKNVNATELGWYEEAFLDVCCRNIATSDDLWSRIIEVSTLLLTCTQRKNPRSSWFERMLNEMLGHLERHPFSREHRIAWLQLIEPVLSAMGLVLLMHFHRIFPLFFQWLHTDDDETILLVLERIHSIIKLTWVRKSPYMARLLDELIHLYKEVETRESRESIRNFILDSLILLQKCKGMQFETSWIKYKDDPGLEKLVYSLREALKAQAVQHLL
ncbi:uncharacterized protein At2g39910 isoform X2 [Dendrobium catenatum]|uniref:Uncharacterized protein n=1 Tax=Dendrobium catenatum TaxID=906689 RepID=A0A2I0W9C8_9ASPA|nr:uncharacterized protein At2g39910 isoform X2 [Dendrobium catenatum]PKU72262.1 Uncharacterized protein MA16_Dca006262 [Dendrobium catenatum]